MSNGATNCPECGSRMAIKATNHGGGITFRVAECDCGERWELEERRARRLQPCTAVHSRGQPPTTVSPPASAGGVGGGLPSGSIRPDSDPIPISTADPKRARARSKTPAEYPPAFDAEWNKTAKTGSKGDALRAWERLSRPAFGDSWKRWEVCDEWKQDWYHYPHVSSWLNDLRYQQDPTETRIKPAARNGTKAESFEARRKREHEDAAEKESNRMIWGEP